MQGTRESMHALSKRILGLVIESEGIHKRANLYLDGDLVWSSLIDNLYATENVVVDEHSYLLEIELEDVEVGIYTCFLYLTKNGEIDHDHFLIIEDVSQTFDPDKKCMNWDVLVVVRANVSVHVCDLYKPMNRMQAEAQGRKYPIGRSNLTMCIASS